MGCWHGWHGCGPWYGPPPGSGWYAPDRWETTDRPLRGRGRRRDRESDMDELEARMAELREEIGRTEAELAELRGAAAALRERTGP